MADKFIVCITTIVNRMSRSIYQSDAVDTTYIRQQESLADSLRQGDNGQLFFRLYASLIADDNIARPRYETDNHLASTDAVLAKVSADYRHPPLYVSEQDYVIAEQCQQALLRGEQSDMCLLLSLHPAALSANTHEILIAQDVIDNTACAVQKRTAGNDVFATSSEDTGDTKDIPLQETLLADLIPAASTFFS